jgi:hypothetical protein
MHFFQPITAPVALTLWLTTAIAHAAASPDVPGAGYASAFDGYLAYQEQPSGNWREHNDAVGQSGAHAGHANAERSTEPVLSSPISPGKPAASETAVDHGAHGK